LSHAQHCLEHRLQFAGRTGDDAQHFRGRGLLLQRFAQLVEQAGVLDGDDGLFCEVADKLDLLVGERLGLLSLDVDGADKFIFFKHWNGEDGPIITKFNGGDDKWIL
jgi:hypothetical protein